tara:strand:+ start:1132 stop:1791 length:660 start_codon:yes stop_codon:yes gene_type:complete
MIMDETKSPLSLEQNASSELSNKLKKSLIHTQKNYFPGVSCSICYPVLRKYAILMRNQKLIWNALSFHHTKIVYFNDVLQSLEGKRIHWIINERHDLSRLKNCCNINTDSTIQVPSVNAFDKYKEVFDHHTQFEKGSIVILLCGCLGRVLAQEWFYLKSDVTFLCLGSYFDSIILQKPHCYDHIDNHKHCDECYNKKIFDEKNWHPKIISLPSLTYKQK